MRKSMLVLMASLVSSLSYAAQHDHGGGFSHALHGAIAVILLSGVVAGTIWWRARKPKKSGCCGKDDINGK